MTVQELINELSKFPKDKVVYTDYIGENCMGEIMLKHKRTDEEQRKIDEDIERRNREWEKEFERGGDMPTFGSRW